MTDNVDDLAAAERAARVAALTRQMKSAERGERIAAINDYTALVVTHLLGIAGIVGGALAWIKPTYLPLNQREGLYVLGGGIALLTGRKVLAQLAKLNS
jgi:hypothetical protein